MLSDNIKCQDVIELYRIDKDTGEWKLDVKTNNNPSIFQRILKWLGLYNCADDALTNWMINQIAQQTTSTLLYASVGNNGTNGTNYGYDDLISPVMTRWSVTPTLVNTYSSDPLLPDTVQYAIMTTATGDYTLKEAGLHTTLTGGHMGSRQVFGDWPVTNGETFGILWKIIYGRG